MTELAETLSAHSELDLATDLALDLILNSIVEQAKLATNASAAAIALATDGEMICRATTGTNAPDLGVRLDSQYGLSGACVRTGVWQRCDDTESDTRVNAEACRYLGVRSILVYPLLKMDELVGVMEVFSSRPSAFSDREIHTLEALSRSVVENIDRAAGVFLPASEDEPILSDLPQPRLMAALASLASETPTARLDEKPSLLNGAVSSVCASDVSPSKKEQSVLEDLPQMVKPHVDRWTTVLTILVIALALTLGWLLGRGRPRQNATAVHPAKTTLSNPSEVGAKKESLPGGVEAKEPAGSGGSAVSKPVKTETASTSQLVVFDKGKVIYRMNQAQTAVGDADGLSSATLQTKENMAAGNAASLSPQVASQYLVGRVEPEYPQQARDEHLEGSVVLQVLVGANGSIESVTTLSGDSTLASAATDAVRQWTFRPYLRNGRSQSFQTQITVTFRMP